MTTQHSSLGIGLVGYGGIGKLHALLYRGLPVAHGRDLGGVRLVAVATATAASAQRAQVETGAAVATIDLAELLACPEVDVVDCCVPTALHEEVAVAALAAGKAVLCEKPLAHSAASAARIASAGGQLGVHYHFRWAPALRHAQRMIADGFLGDLYSARIAYLRASNLDARRPITWRFRRAEGGGVLLDLGSHCVDLAAYLFGPIAAVSARLATVIPRRPGAGGALEEVDVDDAAWLEVEFARGGVATLEASKVAAGSQDDLRVEAYGSRGALRFDAMDPHWLWACDATRPGAPYERLPLGDRHEPPPAVPGADVVGGPASWHQAGLAAFLRAVRTGAAFSPGAAEGLAVQQVLEVAYRSAQEGGRRLSP